MGVLRGIVMRFVMRCFKMSIEIKTKAFKKIKAYAKEMGEDEVGGLLTGEIKDTGDIIILDAILLKQRVGFSTFEIDDKAIMDLTKNADDKLLSSIIGWWHSHGDGFTFWSPVDDDCFKRLCEFSNRCFGIVVSNGKEKRGFQMKSRYDTYDIDGNYISIDDINTEVIHDFSIVSKRNIRKNLKKKVNKEDYDLKEIHKVVDDAI